MREFRRGEANVVVTAGMCTGVAVVLSLLGTIMPPFAGIVSFMVPIPIIAVALLAGVQWGIIACIGTLVLDAMFFGPASTGFLSGIFTILGVIFGICYRRRLPALATLGIGAVGMTAVFLLQGWLVLQLLGIDYHAFSTSYVDTIQQQMNEALPQMMSGDNLTQMQGQMDIMFDNMRKIFFSGIALGMVCVSWITMTLSKFVLTRVGIRDIPHLPDFGRWEMPTFLAYLFIIVFGLGYLYDQGVLGTFDDHGWIEVVRLNVMAVCEFFFFIQGASLIWWMPVRYPSFKTYRWFIYGAVLFLPNLMMLALVEVGLFDMLFRYRKRHNYQ